MKAIRGLGMFTYLIIFLLFFGGTPVSRAFWTGIFGRSINVSEWTTPI